MIGVTWTLKAGQTGSIQELSRWQDGWVTGPHLAPGGDAGRWGQAQVCQGKYQKGGLGSQTHRPPSELRRPALGKHLTQVRQGWGPAGGSQSLGAGITGGFLSWNQAVPGGRLGGDRFSPPGSPDRG